MDNKKMLEEVLALGCPDLLTASKIDDDIGSGRYYSAKTVIRLIQQARDDQRIKCADICEEVAEECNDWDEGGQDGKAGAMTCSTRIRSA